MTISFSSMLSVSVYRYVVQRHEKSDKTKCACVLALIGDHQAIPFTQGFVFS